jgi:hypothetical protein
MKKRLVKQLITPTSSLDSQAPTINTLDICQDLVLCVKGRINFNQRSKIKKILTGFGCDILQPTLQMKNFIHTLQAQYQYEIFDHMLRNVNVLHVLYLNNIRKILEQRCKVLCDRKKLNLSEFSNRIHIGILGDKGAKHFKLGMSIGNAPTPNNPANITLIGLFEGKYSSYLQNFYDILS